MHRLSYGVRMWAEISFVLSQFMHLTDGQTDGFAIAETALHRMQQSKTYDDYFCKLLTEHINQPEYTACYKNVSSTSTGVWQ